jgi:DNA polymerase-1
VPKLTQRIDELQKQINSNVGRTLNVNSPKQIRELFVPRRLTDVSWELLDGTIVGPTKGGENPSIDQHALRAMRDPLAGKIMQLRKTIKTRDTFVLGHVIGHADANGYVHTTFNQTKSEGDVGTGTGRMSSVDPALQQINKRDHENAAIVRALFLPDPGEKWLGLDYDQVDFRMAAHLTNDQRIISAYAANPHLDYHAIVAEMTGIPRNPAYAGGPNAKQLNLSMAFGAGAGKTAFTMGMPYTIVEKYGKAMYAAGPEAIAVLNQYHSRLPGVRQFAKRAEAVATARGYVKTALGRRIRIPKRHEARKAAGLLFQAYAADMHKLGIVQVARAIKNKNLHAKLLLSVHDEIGLSAERDDALAAIIQQHYADSTVLNLRIPITSSVDWGDNWYEASI